MELNICFRDHAVQKKHDQQPKPEMKSTQPKKTEVKEAVPPKIDPKLSAKMRDIKLSQSDIDALKKTGKQ